MKSEDIKLKALFFLNSFIGGGAERVCLNMAKQLFKLNIESDFITIYNREPDYDIPEYIHIFPLKIDNRKGEGWDIIRAVPKVNTFLSGKKYILITAHVQPSQLLASLTKVSKRCLYVMHKSRHQAEQHSTGYERLSLKLFLKGKKIVTVSHGIRDELIQEYGICSRNIETIYNPCSSLDLRNMSVSASPHNRAYILVMGRLVEQKNPLLALELYCKGHFYDQYDLVYLGKGIIEEKLKHRIEEYGMQKYVFVPGFKKNPEQWIKNATLLLSCSRQEGLPMNIIEALICGIPVVAADCPYGPNEILTGELSKYLIHPEKDQENSISVISDALESYPQITEKYYEKFDDGLITKTYLRVWKDFFIQ